MAALSPTARSCIWAAAILEPLVMQERARCRAICCAICAALRCAIHCAMLFWGSLVLPGESRPALSSAGYELESEAEILYLIIGDLRSQLAVEI